MKGNIKYRIFGICLTAFFGLASAVFICFLATTKFLTATLITVGAVALTIIAAAIFFLSFDCRKKVRTVIAALLTLLVFTIQIFGSYYLLVGKTTLEKITTPEIEKAEVGIYVRLDDPAKSLEDAKNYTFGILDVQDREITDSALSKIAKMLGKAVNTKTYSSIDELMNALLVEKEIYAIILNKSFIDLFADIEGHTEDASKIREIHAVLIETEKIVAPPKTDISVFTVYISGIDCSGSITRRSRSDVNIIATVNTKTGQVLLVSTPRDFYVPLSISNGIPDKLTHAGIYGIEVSRDTLAQLYNTDIDYYFRVNFDGFKEIVDSLGGITVDSTYDFSAGGYAFRSGSNNVDGEKALAFARERYHLPGGDRQRGKNQMAVVKGCIAKAASPALLKNYTKVLKSIEGSFETNVPYKVIANLVQQQLDDMTKWNVVSYSVDGTGASKKTYSMSSNAYVMVPNQGTVKKAKRLIKQVEDGLVPKP